jgi:serine/threonine-protein kinase
MAEQPFTTTLKPGVTLDKYEIREQMAAGGMAIIYKAYDPTLDRYVAVKQIAPHLALDEKFAVRFRTEAQTLARLSGTQANIVHVHELIQQDGQLYLVMEYVEGTTLRVMMDKGPLPFQTGLGVMLATVLGLRAMHAQGIVHRDLTPANIMMAKDGALKITDFGLIGHSGGRTSLPMGTTKYMAPEMFTGAPVDPRADLYSLGMIAYEMFTGPEKFAEAFRDVLRDERTQQVRWMHWHSNTALRAPPLKDLQPGIAPLVSKIVERLMEKDPSRRFGSADQVVKWLRKIFVMNVQAKSVSVVDSEAMEKEMETEPATLAAPRPASAAAAASAAGAVDSGEKTAPLAQPKWTWKRAAFWAAIVGAPLIVAAVVLVVWKYNEEQKYLNLVESAQRAAKSLFDSKEYAAAAQAYLKIVQDFPEQTRYAIDANQHVSMARAEEALAKKDWDKADASRNLAESKDASRQWVNDFQTRFQRARDIEEKMGLADAAAKAGDFEKAIAILTDLVGRYPEQKESNEKIAELRDKIELREYRALVDQGKEAFSKRDYDKAEEFLNKARQKRETPEVLELLQAVANDKKLTAAWAEAEKAAVAGKWADAYNYYAMCMQLRPSDAIRAKMVNAKAEELKATARTLKENNLLPDAYNKYLEVLKIKPDDGEAGQFVKAYTQADKLAGLIKAGDEAKAKEDWDGAINMYNQALLLDAADDATKKGVQDKVAECRQKSALAKCREALGQNNFAAARDHLDNARRISETDEVKVLAAEIDKRETFKQHLDMGKGFLAAGDYLKAKVEFETCLKIDPTPEVQELLRETNYRRYVAQAKLLLNNKKARESLGIFKIAQKYKDTPEVKGYVKLVEDILKNEKPE